MLHCYSEEVANIYVGLLGQYSILLLPFIIMILYVIDHFVACFARFRSSCISKAVHEAADSNTQGNPAVSMRDT